LYPFESNPGDAAKWKGFNLLTVQSQKTTVGLSRVAYNAACCNFVLYVTQ